MHRFHSARSASLRLPTTIIRAMSTHHRRAPRTVALALLAGLPLLGACEVPSEAPIFRQPWVIPADTVTVAAADLLPDGITISGTAFAFDTPGANFSATLADLCDEPACQAPGTVTAPTPAFTTTPGALASSVDFPAGVTSATSGGAIINVQITNNLGFDPLRPNGAGTAPFGTMTITVSSGTAEQEFVMTGATQSLANGITTPLVLLLQNGLTLAGALDVDVAFDVPAGGSATISGSNGIAVAVSVQEFLVTQATIALDEDVSTDPTEFDLEDIDFDEEIQGGAVLMDIVNPLTASGTFNATFFAPAQDGQPSVTIAKPFTIAAQPTSTATITLSQSELRSLVGKQGVTIRMDGIVTGTGPGGTVTVTPASEITVRTKLQFTIDIGA